MEAPLQVLENSGDCAIRVNVPKKVLHFSDGTIEEFEDDNDEIDKPSSLEAELIDTKSMTWVPWMKHYAWTSGNKVVEYCDYVGEGLANFLGITTPKYQLEISEYERQQAAEKKRQEEAWIPNNGTNGEAPLVLNQPSPVNQASSEVSPA